MSAGRLDRTCLHVVRAPRQTRTLIPGPSTRHEPCQGPGMCVLVGNTLKQTNKYGLHSSTTQTAGHYHAKSAPRLGTTPAVRNRTPDPPNPPNPLPLTPNKRLRYSYFGSPARGAACPYLTYSELAIRSLPPCVAGGDGRGVFSLYYHHATCCASHQVITVTA